MKKAFGTGNLEFSLEGADRHKFELNEKRHSRREGRNRSRNKESSMVIEFKMSGAWINDFLLCQLHANIACILRKTVSHEWIRLMQI